MEADSFDYFINATAFFKKKLYRPYFYFFSDKPEWVKMDLLPRLSVKDCAEVVDIMALIKVIWIYIC